MGAEPSTPRVFVGPVEIAGYYSGLAGALRDLGLDALSFDLSRHRYRYGDDPEAPLPVRAAFACRDRVERRAPRSAGRRFWRGLETLAHVWLVAWSVRRFDVFIFGYGSSVLGLRELPLLKRLGKRLIFVFNGSDARPSYVDGADMAESLGRDIDDAVRLAREKKAKITRIERYADVIVSQPAFSHFFERPIVDFFRIGHPVRPWGGPGEERAASDTIRILHSPSSPEVKGSVRIRDTVDALKAAGHRLELVELRGVPNDQVRAEIERSDFVIDQIYSDAPMVGFATEAAVAGRPAIVGGYAWPHLREIYPDGSMPPVEMCEPESLGDAILRLSTDAAHRRDLGEQANAFVTTTWAPSVIAERYVSLMRGEIREEWLFDPRRLRYVRGVGLTEERARGLVAGVIARGGRAALQLADKPEVEQAFVDFAEGR
jgi:hypothetical protein